MFNIVQFNRCNQEQKVALVLDQGQFIQIRVSGDYSIVLYAIGKFYAEIWYKTATSKFFMVRGFSNQDMLDPYLETIDLTQLIDY
ncbi:hypothetical protein [Adhaeribacter pallidiroseus]|uniref:Uncharacterized protein n=1 Tax=Adhaeribacter pallidiroseus TaxID=2072847 RepID=A0A369QI93_9BACT|nr:hypothetical protein [Adhaeribacter pallidiroseus]RDC64623.1 hypothetical protein AHMF7616_03239 [Adhaeribacter pallidiroseus]